MSQDHHTSVTERQQSTLIGVVMFLIVIGGMLGYAVGLYQGQYRTRVEAVQRGHAQWMVDTEGGTSFVWKEGKRP